MPTPKTLPAPIPQSNAIQSAITVDPLDYSAQYNTPIPPAKQKDFEKWVADQAKQTKRNPLGDRYNYDVNGFFLNQQNYGAEVREPYTSEREYFRRNPNVSGMAAEDNKVTLNPFSGLNPEEQQAVIRNEAARLHMRKNKIIPAFDLTDAQRAAFAGTAYSKDDSALKQSIAARILSGDPSAGDATPQQKAYAQKLRQELEGTDSRGHGSDRFKKPNHPTFSVESQYHPRNGAGGQWMPSSQPGIGSIDPKSGDTVAGGLGGYYQPSALNLMNSPRPELGRYFNEVEPDVMLLGALPTPREIGERAMRKAR